MRSLLVIVVVCLALAQGNTREPEDPKEPSDKRANDFTFGGQKFTDMRQAAMSFMQFRRDISAGDSKMEANDTKAHTSDDSSSKVGQFVKDLLGSSKDSAPIVMKGAVVKGDQVNSRKRMFFQRPDESVNSFDRRTAFVVNSKVDGKQMGGEKSEEGASKLKAALDEMKNSTRV